MPPKAPSTPSAPRPAPATPRAARQQPVKAPATSRIVVPQVAKPASPPAPRKSTKVGDGLFKKAIKVVDGLGTKKAPKPVKTAVRQSVEAKAKPAANTIKTAQTSPKTPQVKNPVNFRIPQSIINDSKTWTHKSFATTRKKTWQRLAEHKEWLAENPRIATRENIVRMKQGKAPYAPADQQAGKRKKIELDHIKERRDGVKELDLRNIRGVDPVTHGKKITRKQNKAAGDEIAKDLRDPAKYKPDKTTKVSTAQKLKNPLKLF